jgi:hypothetical protein
MIVTGTEYKGQAILVFKRNETDKFPFSFGVKKAKVILEHIQEIQAFYEAQKHTLKTKED